MDLDSIVDIIESEAKYHLKQQPNSIVCSECGCALVTIDAHIDQFLDMSLKIKPCEYCMRQMLERGIDYA